MKCPSHICCSVSVSKIKKKMKVLNNFIFIHSRYSILFEICIIDHNFQSVQRKWKQINDFNKKEGFFNYCIDMNRLFK